MPFPATITALPLHDGRLNPLRVLLFLACLQTAQPLPALTLDEIGGGELLFEAGAGYQPALQLGTKIDVQVSGLIAHVTVEQRFRNTQSDWADGRYVFPLAETAAVNAMEIRVDGRVIVGEIHEKQTAQKIYSTAKQAGKRAALLEQHRPNLFATRIANLGPGQEISVILTYVEKISFDHGTFSLRLPTTYTPRYQPKAAEDAATVTANAAAWVDEQTEFMGDEAMNPLQITARIDAGMPLAELASPYHPVTTERNATTYRIKLAEQLAAMDRDFVLRWQPAAGIHPQAALFAEEVGDDTYAMLMIVPPTRTPAYEGLAREVVFIIDTSGSMSGTSIEQARSALQTALGSLGRRDRFNIIAFDDDVTKLFSEARLADGSYLQDAWNFVDGLAADGGTEMAPALRAALVQRDDATRAALRQVVFITDGAVGNEQALLQQIHTQLGASRLFTVGIGSAPNSYFMRKAAQFGRGSFTHIGDVDEVQARMSELFQQLSAPQLQNVTVKWNEADERFPERIPDLYAGQPLVVTAHIKGTGQPLQVTVAANGNDWQQTLRLGETRAHAGVATLWARDKLEALYDRITETGESDKLRAAIVAVGLTHRLVSRYTSFVAVEQAPVRPAGTNSVTRSVPNARPAGQMLRLPQTATSASTHLLIGLLSLVLMLLASCAESHSVRVEDDK